MGSPGHSHDQNGLSGSKMFIDLTEDDDNDGEPVAKKIVIYNDGASTSRGFPPPAVPVPAPSASRRHKQCSSCGSNFQGVNSINLTCGHRYCYRCFIFILRRNQKISNHCLHCNDLIDDDIVRASLMPTDYIYYLEHTRDNLRRALKDKDQNGLTNGSAKSSTETELHRLNDMSFVKNSVPFECPICMTDIRIDDGVILKNCLHTFCKACIEETVKHSDEPQVSCPFNDEHGSCEFHIQEREIRALVTEETLEKHLEKSFKRAATSLDNVFHCKTPDCAGFIQHAEDSRAFLCPVCNAVNCISCKVIHDGKTCHEYMLTFKNDEKSQLELRMNEAAVNEMLNTGEVRTTLRRIP